MNSFFEIRLGSFCSTPPARIHQCKTWLLLVGTFLFIAGCGTDALKEVSISGEWSLVGFEGEAVQFIRSVNNGVYLATKTELYESNAADLSSWTSKNMSQILKEGERVRDFLVFNEAEILGVVFYKDEVSPEEREEYWDNFVSLFRTTDGGETWEPLYNEFTENEAYVGNVAAAPEMKTIYAGHAGNVAQSKDRGISWSPLHWFGEDKKWVPHTNVSFIKVNPFHTDVIWTIGSNITTGPQIIRTLNKGESWEIYNPIFADGYGGGPLRDVEFAQRNDDKVMVGMADCIQLTKNSGESWERIYEDKAVFAMERGTVTGETVYASGRIYVGENSGRLYIAFTPDFGKNWQTFFYQEGPTDAIVNDLAVTQINGQETVLLATNQGLYSFSVD
ncbi:WD40/YVTN/BNR-like repeat-containing protein [Gracilimonas sp.]|uniref:WD40/YVTN/BNR-like repeat-containing protein n=1 Tax=Gracilimonas sp. TaxID=1974203 RepID=UPI003BAD2437